MWIEKHNTIPPTEFAKLYRDAGLCQELVTEIDGLITRKMAGVELDMEPKIEIINSFLEHQIEHCSQVVEGMEMVEIDENVLDALFQEMLKKWLS